MCGGGIRISVIISDDRLMTEDSNLFHSKRPPTHSQNSRESDYPQSYRKLFHPSSLLGRVPTVLVTLMKAHGTFMTTRLIFS